VIPALRTRFNRDYTDEKYAALLSVLDERSAAKVEFRVSETPVFVAKALLQQMADEGAALAFRLIANTTYLSAARRAIPHHVRPTFQEMDKACRKTSGAPAEAAA